MQPKKTSGDMVEKIRLTSRHFYLAFSKCLHYSLSNDEKISNTLWAFPKDCSISFNTLKALLKESPTALSPFFSASFVYSAFSVHHPQSTIYASIKMENRDTTINLQTFSFNYAQYNHPGCSPTQDRFDSPFNGRRS
jgi:hypothetical protein